MSEPIDDLEERGIACLESFRRVFKPECREQYKLTLIARDPNAPDGSRDVIITSDTAQGIRAATDLRFPPIDEALRVPSPSEERR